MNRYVSINYNQPVKGEKKHYNKPLIVRSDFTHWNNYYFQNTNKDLNNIA